MNTSLFSLVIGVTCLLLSTSCITIAEPEEQNINMQPGTYEIIYSDGIVKAEVKVIPEFGPIISSRNNGDVYPRYRVSGSYYRGSTVIIYSVKDDLESDFCTISVMGDRLLLILDDNWNFRKQ